jgi:hypothetical protein
VGAKAERGEHGANSTLKDVQPEGVSEPLGTQRPQAFYRGVCRLRTQPETIYPRAVQNGDSNPRYRF